MKTMRTFLIVLLFSIAQVSCAAKNDAGIPAVKTVVSHSLRRNLSFTHYLQDGPELVTLMAQDEQVGFRRINEISVVQKNSPMAPCSSSSEWYRRVNAANPVPNWRLFFQSCNQTWQAHPYVTS